MNRIATIEIPKSGELKIPKDFLLDLQFKPGMKIIVLESKNDLLLKKVEEPSFGESFDKLIGQTQKEIQKKGITKNDLVAAIKKVRAEISSFPGNNRRN